MKKEDILTVIKQLASKRAPSGLEKERGEIFKKEIENVLKGKDIPVKIDELGNYYVKFKSNNKKKAIAIFAHLDEIGGTVRNIKKNGRLEFSRRGGYEGRWLISKTVEILNREGHWIKGVITGRSSHSTPEKLRVREKFDPLEMEIYIGASNKREIVNDYKIHVGAPIVFSGEFGLLNGNINDNVIAGYSMDNLTALTCLVVITQKIAKDLVDDSGCMIASNDVYIVATAREEIGTEGAYFFAKNNQIDEVIGIDIGIVEDISGSVHSGINLNKGPVIVWQESSGTGVLDYTLCMNLTKVAEVNKLSFQNGVFEFYSSDAGKAQKWVGIPSALIGIPTMFSHNVPEISTLMGIESAAELIFQYLKSLE